MSGLPNKFHKRPRKKHFPRVIESHLEQTSAERNNLHIQRKMRQERE